ncbi:MAG: thermonuclease family protein [Candidatus Aenigmarchaeota archaeon]|nr:thermonuclease family protein [Candidatus Aenigmarchaeota archaeon]
MKTFVVAISLVIALSFLSAYYIFRTTGLSIVEREKYLVTRVTDGDTIVIESGDPVRLLGIDTPEKGEKCYKEATNRLKELILNKEVEIERDEENKDRYKRLLRYVFYNGTFINELLVAEGYAHLYFIEPNTKYNDVLKKAAQSAKNEGKGCLWKP